MTAPSLDSFFAGGGKSLSWKDVPVGTTYGGYIKTVNPPTQQTDPVDGKPQFKRDGVTPKMSVRIDLQTDLRDPTDPEDDGMRSLYVQGWMQGAIGDAVRKTGRQGPPETGGHLQVTLTAREPNENRALNPTNKFSAVYTPPQAQATQQFFEQGPAPSFAQPVQQAPPQQNPYPNGMSATGAPLPPQQVSPIPPQQAPPQPQYQQAPVQQETPPVKPPQMSDAAWAAMPIDTQRQVAAAMSQPPY